MFSTKSLPLESSATRFFLGTGELVAELLEESGVLTLPRFLELASALDLASTFFDPVSGLDFDFLEDSLLSEECCGSSIFLPVL